MKRILSIVIAFIVFMAFSYSTTTVKAEDTVNFVSQHYLINDVDGKTEITGKAAFSSRCSSDKKIEMKDYAIKIDLDFDYEQYSLDWVAFVFSPSENPFLNSGAAISLVIRPRGSELHFSIMNRSYTDMVSAVIKRSEDDVYSITANLTDSSASFTVNGTEIKVESKAVNYSLLSRGVYTSIAVNGRSDCQEAPFKLTVLEKNFVWHDTSKDVIVYGSSISIDELDYLTSDNFTLK